MDCDRAVATRTRSRTRDAAAENIQAVPAPEPAPASPSLPHRLRSRSRPGAARGRQLAPDASRPPRAAAASRKRGRGDVAVDAPAADAPASKRAKPSSMPPPAQPRQPSSDSASLPPKNNRKKKNKGKKKNTSTPAEEADDESDPHDTIPATDDESERVPPLPTAEVALEALAPALITDNVSLPPAPAATAEAHPLPIALGRAGEHVSPTLPASSSATLPNPFISGDGQTTTTFDGSPAAILKQKCAVNHLPAGPELEEEFPHHASCRDSDDEEPAEDTFIDAQSGHLCGWQGCPAVFNESSDLKAHVLESHDDLFQLFMYICSSPSSVDDPEPQAVGGDPEPVGGDPGPEGGDPEPVGGDPGPVAGDPGPVAGGSGSVGGPDDGDVSISSPVDDRAKDPDYQDDGYTLHGTPLGPQKPMLVPADREKYRQTGVIHHDIGKKGAYKCAITWELVKETSEWAHHVWRNKPPWMTWDEWLQYLYILSRVCGLPQGAWLNADVSRNISRLGMPYHRALDGRLLAFLPTDEWLEKIKALLKAMKAAMEDEGHVEFPKYSSTFPDQMRDFVLIPITTKEGNSWRPSIHRRRADLEEELAAKSTQAPICKYLGCGRLFNTREDMAEHLPTHAYGPARAQPSSGTSTSVPTPSSATSHEDIYVCSCEKEVFERHHWPYTQLILRLWAHPYLVIFDLMTKLPSDGDLNRVEECHWELVMKAQDIWREWGELVGPIPKEHLKAHVLPPYLGTKLLRASKRAAGKAKANDDDPQTPTNNRKGRKL